MANGDNYSEEDYQLYGNLLDQGIDPDEYTIVEDIFGNVILEGTFDYVYGETLQTAEEFEAYYGDYTITELIADLELMYDIEWDWNTWRSLYDG